MNSRKPWMISSALALGVGVLGVGTGIQPAAGVPESSGWLSNYETAKAVARQSGRPLFVVIR